jgi:DDE family transposase
MRGNKLPDEAVRLEGGHLADLKLAAAKMVGPGRRAFEAEMVSKYCEGNAWRGERVFGWSRHTIALGLAEQRTGIVCLGAQEAFSGNHRWEEKQPQAAEALRAMAESHAQQDPSFRGALAYTRLTAKAAREQLRAQGFAEAELPAPSTMAGVLNRNGYRLRPVLKAKPQKKSRKPMPSSPTSAPRMAKAR